MSVTNIRITGPLEASYQLGRPMSVYEGNVLLATLDPVLVLNRGTQVHVEALIATRVMLDQRKHVGRLIFFEICAFVTQNFPQIQAVSFAFAHPIDGIGGPAQQAALRAAAMESIGVEDVHVNPITSGAHVVSGTWVYNEKNLAALQVALQEQRAILEADPIVVEKGGLTGAFRRLVAARRWLNA